jgi:phosphoribosylformimino-5-aminoimidazole carboxamide ribotide isomerase
MTVIPAIDIEGGKCVRLVRGERGTETVFSEDPVEVALEWQAQGARLIHVVDLDAAFDAKESNRPAVARIVGAVRVPVQVGGGVRSFADFHRLRGAGVARIVFGTAAAKNPLVLRQALGHDASSVVVGIDVRDGKVAVRGWREDSEHGPIELGKRWVGEGVTRFVYTDISRDGVMTGPNVEAVRGFAKETGARVVASGGIGSLEDLRRLRAAEADGVEAAIVGRALYERVFTLTEAMEIAQVAN